MQSAATGAACALAHATWLAWVADTLPDSSCPGPAAPRVVDLFAGCGGLSLGFEAAGCAVTGYEMRADAVATHRRNLSGTCHHVRLAPGAELETADILVGGVPCQPFSQAGRQLAEFDPRDGFPSFLDAATRLRPKVALVENVRGLLLARNRAYLDAVSGSLRALGYQVEMRLLDATGFGVPQRRSRLVIAAHTGRWQWPEPTVQAPVSAGTALGPSMAEAVPGSRFLTPAMDRYVAAYEANSGCRLPRDIAPGRPSRTVTCRNLGAATSDMLRVRLPDGRRRRLTLREGARLQGFPDWFEFEGNDYERMAQVGNAVPPLMGRALAVSAMRSLG